MIRFQLPSVTKLYIFSDGIIKLAYSQPCLSCCGQGNLPLSTCAAAQPTRELDGHST